VVQPAFWHLEQGSGPLVAVASHHGHLLRPELEGLCALSASERRREEDPFTGDWTAIAPTRLIAQYSRFEVDLNRPRDQAVYRTPQQAWGLRVWSNPLDPDLLERSLERYDAFYARLEALLRALLSRHQRLVVLDLHSYNYRRHGRDGPPADPAGNPDVNLGTGTMDRRRWGPVVDGFLDDLRSYDYLGRPLDVRENVRFRGGNLPRWIHTAFPDSVCVLAIEVKKFFMDEWTGAADPAQLAAVEAALRSTTGGILERLRTGS
jgi:N-formylglutamate deformylase